VVVVVSVPGEHPGRVAAGRVVVVVVVSVPGRRRRVAVPV
jgi:hypothetical protein